MLAEDLSTRKMVEIHCFFVLYHMIDLSNPNLSIYSSSTRLYWKYHFGHWLVDDVAIIDWWPVKRHLTYIITRFAPISCVIPSCSCFYWTQSTTWGIMSRHYRPTKPMAIRSCCYTINHLISAFFIHFIPLAHSLTLVLDGEVERGGGFHPRVPRKLKLFEYNNSQCIFDSGRLSSSLLLSLLYYYL